MRRRGVPLTSAERVPVPGGLAAPRRSQFLCNPSARFYMKIGPLFGAKMLPLLHIKVFICMYVGNITRIWGHAEPAQWQETDDSWAVSMDVTSAEKQLVYCRPQQKAIAENQTSLAQKISL